MDTLKAVFAPLQSSSVRSAAQKDASSGGSVGVIETPTAPAPAQLTNQQDPNNPANKQQIASAVKDINHFFQMSQRSLDFSLDDASGKMVLQIKDTATNEVIRQIPSEQALMLAKQLDNLTGLLFKAQA